MPGTLPMISHIDIAGKAFHLSSLGLQLPAMGPAIKNGKVAIVLTVETVAESRKQWSTRANN